MKEILLLIMVFFCTFSTYAQSKIIQELKDSNQVQMGLYFSPSTLRMLNIQKDTAYDKMIKGIEKLNLLVMRPAIFTADSYYDTYNKLMNIEQYEEYIIWEGEDYQMEVLGKPKKKEIIALANYQDKYYILNLKGTIDLMQIPDLYQKMSSQDSTTNIGFSLIYDMIKSNDDKRLRREKRQKEWKEREEKRKKEENAKKEVEEKSDISG